MFIDFSKPNDMRVINCNVGDRNGITLKRLVHLVEKYSRAYPSKYTMLYPYLHTTTNSVVHAVHETIHTFLPAYVADFGLRLLGKKPIMVKVQKKIKVAAELGKMHCKFQLHYTHHYSY